MLNTMGVDVDGDGASNEEELNYGSDPLDLDSDDDGINDGDEIHLANEQAQKGYSLLHWDTNGDYVSDYDDFYNCFTVSYPGGALPSFPNATYSDYDGDGIKNPFDPYPTDPTNNDTDGDGLINEIDPGPADASNTSGYNGVTWGSAALEDSDNDGISNFWDSSPYDQSNGSSDSDNDGIENNTDPFPSDNSNYSPINGIYWYGNVFGDDDWDGSSNYSDPWPYDSSNGGGGSGDGSDTGSTGNTSNDSDSDGIEDSLDPAPSDGNNYSTYNGYNWGSAPLEDADNDGIQNFFDSYPYDSYNNTTDADYDGVGNELDPYPNDSTNYSPTNNTSWYGNLFGDDDGDGVPNYSDYFPYDAYNGSSDADGDGFTNDLDPYPQDSSNFSQTNNTAWYGELFGDADNDGNPNWSDSSPYPIDSDGDGIGDSIDPAPSDQFNYSSHNSLSWTNPLGDDDGDSIQNFWDAYPNDSTNGADSTDWDNDGIENGSDPAPYDPSNYSSYNGISWYNGALDDSDMDMIANYYDVAPYSTSNADNDNDGILNFNDPDPNGYTNYSPINYISWYSEAILDSDGDGTINFYDYYPYGDPPPVFLTDQDADGLNADQESTFGTSDNDPDSDDDGLTDYEEAYVYYTNPTNAYSISQARNWANIYTDWQLADQTDSDSDGIPDRIEQHYGLNPNWAHDAKLDLDNNGISNWAQYQAGMALNSSLDRYDGDGDGMTDIFEDFYSSVLSKSNPLDAVQDPDGDGVMNYEEMRFLLSPQSADTHQTGNPMGDLLVLMTNIRYPTTLPSDEDSAPQNNVPDWADAALTAPSAPDHNYFTRQAEGDLDGDGIPDQWEHEYGLWKYPNGGLNPRFASDAGNDPDRDGLTNLTEYRFGSNPLASQTITGVDDNSRFNRQGGMEAGSSIPGRGGLMSRYRAALSNPSITPGMPGNYNFTDIRLADDSSDPEPIPVIEVRKTTYTISDHAKLPLPSTGLWNRGESIKAKSDRVPELTESRCQCGCMGTFEEPKVCLRTRETCSMGYLEQIWETQETREGWIDDDGVEHVYTHEHPVKIGERWVSTCGCVPKTWERQTAHLRVTLSQPHVKDYVVSVQVINSKGKAWRKKLRVPAGDTMSDPVEITETAQPDSWVKISRIHEPSGDPTLTFSASDRGGSRYRKIGLNGMPMSDSKPQVQDESGEAPESTYIDAYTRQLHHSVSDVYATDEVTATLLPLSVRRDAAADCSNLRGGLKQNERPDRPFGPAWTSNICAYIHFEEDSSNAVMSATVVDEQGSQQRFVQNRLFPSGWTHTKEESADLRTAFNVLNSLTLVKKFGTTCQYEMAAVTQTHSTDRLEGSDHVVTHTYARLKEVVDRLGNRLVYEYVDDSSLVPFRIYDPVRPGRQLYISMTNGKVSKVQAPDGAIIDYSYNGAGMLSSVTRGTSSVGYGYTFAQEISEENLYSHYELSSITDELGQKYSFTHEFNQSVRTKMVSVKGVDYKKQHGMPMRVTGIYPPGPNSEVISLASSGEITTDGITGELVIDAVCTVVSGPAGNYSYTFYAPIDGGEDIYSILNSNSFDFDSIDESPMTISQSIAFMGMQITGPLGAETYLFEPSTMALISAKDLSGNETTFTYQAGYDDPLTEKDPLGHVKSFTYDPETRVMTSMTDALGTVTAYGIQDKILPNGDVIRGLKMSETVTALDGTTRSTFYAYDHPVFHGMVTRQWSPSANPDAPGSITVTTLAAPNDSSGSRPGWWAEVTTTSGVPDNVGELSTALTSTTTIHDFVGRKRSVIDPRGLLTNFDYDTSGRLAEVAYPDGSTKTLAYDAHGNLTTETNELGSQTFHAYDHFNRRTQTTVDLNGSHAPDAGDLVSTTVYNVRNQVTSQTDYRGNTTVNTYDAGGRLTAVNVAGLETLFFYDGPNNGGSLFDSSGIKPNRTTDPRGVITTVVYDKLYRPVSSTVMAPGITAVTLTEYDAAGRPKKVTDPLGRVTTNVYDGLGQLIKVIEPDLTACTTDNPTVSTLYTPHGKPWKVTDQNGAVTTTSYDALGRPVKVKSPAVDGVQAVVTTEYDAAGNAVRVTDALGRETETIYDVRNRPVRVFAPTVWDGLAGQLARPVTTTVYDSLGQVIEIQDLLGAVTTMHYDNAGRKWKTEAPPVEAGAARPTTITTFDAGGLPLTVTNPLGQTVTNTYDIHGRLKTTVDAEGITTIFEYDPAGNRTSVTDGKGQVTSFLYDGLNRLTHQTFANGDEWTHHYDAMRKESQTSPRGIVTTYTYDARDRLKSVSSPAHAGTPALGRAYTYDPAGRLLTVAETGNLAADVSYVYDAMGRLTAESSRGQTHQYRYDLAGNRVQTTYSTGRVVRTSYDGLNRPEVISEGGRVTRYGYDLAGRAVVLVAGNGQTSSNTYDALGRLQDRTLFKTSAMTEADVQAEFSWQHDALGNVLAQHETWPGEVTRQGGIRSTVMIYDANNRLVAETIQTRVNPTATPVDQSSTAYTYDAANNRATKTVTRIAAAASSAEAGENEVGHWAYTYNSANQLAAWEKWDEENGTLQKSATLSYDDAGNRTGQTVDHISTSASDEVTSYTWDAQDRLLGVTMPDGSQHAYEYDYRTRRIGTNSTTSGATPTTKQTAIVFSGGLSVAEWESETGSLPVPPTVEYTRGPDMGGGVGGLLYSLRRESSSGLQSVPRYNLSNGRGDIVAQSNQSAALTWTASYEAYGKRTKETGTNQDKQRGNSKDEDPTGLLNEGFRYRDLETGVWLSRDPAGFVDGPNVYAYVRQNPWTGFDPDGLETALVEEAVRGADAAFQSIKKFTGKSFSIKDYNSPAKRAAVVAAATETLALMELNSDKVAPPGTLYKGREGGGIMMNYPDIRRGTAIPAGTNAEDQQRYQRENGSNPSALANLNNATKPGGNSAKKNQEDAKTYITYVLKDASGNVAYVGRASGKGTPEQVLKSRLSKGHDVYDADRTLIPEVIDTQSSADANKGAEKLWHDHYKNKGAALRNDPKTPPLSDKPSKQQSTQRRVDSYIEQDINKK